eukprot:m.636482 g.636482  ORF g.636482 m.636482 type:complete len:627 (+) comp58310_c0_seq9:184-2064(+)
METMDRQQDKDQIARLMDDLGLVDDVCSDEETTTMTAARSDKLKFVEPQPQEFESLASYMKSMLTEGHGEFILPIGLSEDGKQSGLTEAELAKSRETVLRLARMCDAEVTDLRLRAEDEGTVCDVLIRRNKQDADFMDVRVAVCGNVDAGKSTLLGVLTHCELDNGRGRSRSKVFRHKHEIDTGRTSSISTDILGFDARGNITNKPSHDGSLDWPSICASSSKVISFIDLAGHEKYLKTTVFGLTGHAPDYVMLMVGANAGIIGMTKEHLGLALALNVPVFIVVTKIDMCPANILEMTLRVLQKMLKSPGCRKLPVMVSSSDDVIVAASNFVSERICPIFQVSNVTGENIDKLKLFLNLLQTRTPVNDHLPAEFQIDEVFTVPGVGAVISGTTLQGTIRVNDTLLLGPDQAGRFQSVTIKSIYRRRTPAMEVRGGQTASFALKKIRRKDLRKGMVLVSPALKPQATWEFECELVVLHHPTTITAKYQAMMHCGAVRQNAAIVAMDSEHLRSGDRTSVVFRFIKQPEYLHLGSKIIFREGRAKAVGSISKIFPAGYTGVRLNPTALPADLADEAASSTASSTTTLTATASAMEPKPAAALFDTSAVSRKHDEARSGQRPLRVQNVVS